MKPKNSRRHGVVFCALLLASLGLAAQGSVIVRTNVPGANIYLDGRYLGVTDGSGMFYADSVSVGPHAFRFEKDGYVSQDASHEVGDLTSTLSVSLEPQTGSEPAGGGQASLFLDTNVGGAVVLIDGRQAGQTGSDGKAMIATAPGSHVLRVEKDGYEPLQDTVSILADLTNQKTMVLQAAAGGDGGQDPLVLILVGILVVSLVIAGFVIYKVFGSSGAVHERFDQYLVQELIGKGGMATIYRARDLESKAPMALKLMDEAYLNDRDLVEKFFREGQVISEINRDFPTAPVVRVFRYGRENGTTWGRPFIAMELLKGPNLLQFIKNRRDLHPVFILRVLKQLGEALQAAHVKGVYHRDITPDNIILVRNDPVNPEIRLIDFGVARHEYTAAGTLDGSIAGKPAYMSPEQCRGEKVDGRSDIYSMGIVFYTLLTGAPPFISNNPLEVMTHHQHTPVPPLPGRVSPQISQVVLKMLKKDKNERYGSMGHLIGDISRLLQEAS